MLTLAPVIVVTHTHHLSLHCNLSVEGQQLELSKKFKERDGEENTICLLPLHLRLG